MNTKQNYTRQIHACMYNAVICGSLSGLETRGVRTLWCEVEVYETMWIMMSFRNSIAYCQIMEKTLRTCMGFADGIANNHQLQPQQWNVWIKNSSREHPLHTGFLAFASSAICSSVATSPSPTRWLSWARACCSRLWGIFTSSFSGFRSWIWI